jgi:hypothetical protein
MPLTQGDFHMRLPNRLTFAFGFVLLLNACGSGDGNSGSDSSSGRASLSVTDAPVDEASSVVIQFSGVTFKRAGAGQEVVANFGPPRQLDLLQYQEGRAALLLDNVVLPAGEYEWVRLTVDNQPNVRDSYLVRTTGEECEMRVPSGAESGLKLNRGFSLPANGAVALTIDFDLRKSVHAPPGQSGQGTDCTQGYLLRPTLRLVDNANVGAIVGTVDSALVTTGCLPKVYVFGGSGTAPDDIEEANATGDVDPIVVASVNVQNGATLYRYTAAFMPPGNYTVAFTCSDDLATTDEVLTFVGAQNVVVQANVSTIANFAPPPPASP